MHEILAASTDRHRILDLGARHGSFAAPPWARPLIVRLDLDQPPHGQGDAGVQADASAMPFAEDSFDVVIANHSLEHMVQVRDVLAEVGRVLRPDGALYVAVPDGTSMSDRLYRWVYHGGGHVNLFRSPEELDALIRRYVPLRLVGWRKLYSSFGFLKGSLFHPRPPRRMWLFLNGHYGFLVVFTFLTRLLDRFAGTDVSRYGWALYYGNCTVDAEAWANVCVNCGDAQAASSLAVRRLAVVRWYACPACGARNLFTPDFQ